MRTGDVAVQARLHTSGLWLTIPVVAGHEHALDFVFDTGSPVSAISPETRDDLSAKGLLTNGQRPGWFRLAGITVQGQAIPDLDLRVLGRLSRLKIDGLIGLNYLSHFESVHFQVPTLYSHPESRFPTSADIPLEWASLSQDQLQKLYWDNPVRFFGEP